ncbi:MAG: HDOD domain-containing protein [Planctomycetaceae bacterium]|nr:HDOD domain-containing protein [Planctomycetaceae bacterium]
MVHWQQLRETHLGVHFEDIIPPNVKLPMLPSVVIEFTRKAEDPDVSTQKLTKIIESDAGITTELLRYVNSSMVGLRNKASSVQQALNLLGIRTVKLFLITTGMKSALSSRQSKMVNLKNFWATNLERALFSREIARLLGADSDLAFAASMLQDSLLPVLTNELYKYYVSYAELPEESNLNLTSFEDQTFRWNHTMATAAVMHHWGFPDDLICCILFHHKGLMVLSEAEMAKSPIAAVAVASLLPDPLNQERNGLVRLHKLQTLWPKFELDKVVEAVDSQFAELSPGVSPDFPLKHRYDKMMEKMGETAEAAPAATPAG